MIDSLDGIFAEARRYGLVDLFTLDGGTYSCSILVAVEDKELKAKSGFKHATPQAAVAAAIRVADAMMSAAANPPVRHATEPLAA